MTKLRSVSVWFGAFAIIMVIGSAILPVTGQAVPTPPTVPDPSASVAALFPVETAWPHLVYDNVDMSGPGVATRIPHLPEFSPVVTPQTPVTGLTLTPTEYAQLKKLIDRTKATPQEVALVNMAVKGSGLLLGFGVWLICLLILRVAFLKLWDEDVSDNGLYSTLLLIAIIIGTAWIIGTVVS